MILCCDYPADGCVASVESQGSLLIPTVLLPDWPTGGAGKVVPLRNTDGKIITSKEAALDTVFSLTSFRSMFSLGAEAI